MGNPNDETKPDETKKPSANNMEQNLEILVSRITKENKPDLADTDFGSPVGREIL